MYQETFGRLLPPLVIGVSMLGAAVPVPAQQLPEVITAARPSALIREIQKANERLEITVNTSRRLTFHERIREAQVNDPEIVDIVPLSPTMIQVSAKAAGVTQINLWAEQKPGEEQKVYTIDVIAYGDTQELTMHLKAAFPHASLKVVPIGGSVLISGYVDRAEDVDLIIRIASEFYPNVINKISVSGVQQVLLHVKVIEISRTKLRKLGFDFSQIVASANFTSTAAGIIAGAETVSFGILNGGETFLGVVEALREDKLAKILAEPNIVAVSGRPSYFHVGGEVLFQLSGGITGPTTESVQYGTRIDFVAVVLGNGRIRLEVRSRVTELDAANSAGGLPATKFRVVDTGVEMQAGQTLAIAGLVQERVESQNRGLPWISELPYVGALFRRVEEEINEVELVILVTPELVDAMDAHEVPPCLPGLRTASPTDWELFMRGHIEVPNCCPNGPDCDHGVPPDGMILQEGQPADSTYRNSTSGPAISASGRFNPWLQYAAGPTAQNTAVHRPGTSYDRYKPTRSQTLPPASVPKGQDSSQGFIGPIGYDVVK